MIVITESERSDAGRWLFVRMVSFRWVPGCSYLEPQTNKLSTSPHIRPLSYKRRRLSHEDFRHVLNALDAALYDPRIERDVPNHAERDRQLYGVAKVFARMASLQIRQQELHLSMHAGRAVGMFADSPDKLELLTERRSAGSAPARPAIVGPPRRRSVGRPRWPRSTSAPARESCSPARPRSIPYAGPLAQLRHLGGWTLGRSRTFPEKSALHFAHRCGWSKPFG